MMKMMRKIMTWYNQPKLWGYCNRNRNFNIRLRKFNSESDQINRWSDNRIPTPSIIWKEKCLVIGKAEIKGRICILRWVLPELNFRSRILKFRFRLQKPRSFEASVGYIVIIFIIFLIIFIIMFLIIPTIFFNNIFSSFLAAFLYSKKSTKIEKR